MLFDRASGRVQHGAAIADKVPRLFRSHNGITTLLDYLVVVVLMISSPNRRSFKSVIEN
jgi:hypothetical protein